MVDVSAVVHNPDGTTTEHFDSKERFYFKEDIKKFAQDILWYKSGLKTSRKNPITVKVEVYTFKFNMGNYDKHLVGTFDLFPSKERLTKEEYESELKEALSDIDSCFHKFISQKAYDEGHSSGYEECLMIAEDLISNLSPAIEHYKNKLTQNVK